MKNVRLFVLFVFLVSFSASGQSIEVPQHSLSFGVSTGLLAGAGEEIVYHKLFNELTSQLLWNMKPLAYAGGELSYMWFNQTRKSGLFADVSVKFGFPGNTGIIEDRDWLSDHKENMGISFTDGVYNPKWLTNYSVHDNRTAFAMLIDSKLGMANVIFDKLLLKYYARYSYMQFSWEASGGSILYPDIVDLPFIFPGHFYLADERTNMTYTQTWHIVSLGISLYGDFNRYFAIEPYFNGSVLTRGLGVDKHILRDLVFEDTHRRGFTLEPGFIFSYKINPSLVWSLAFSYRRIVRAYGNEKVTGDELLKEYGTRKVIFLNAAGGGYSAFDIGLVLKYNFFGRSQSRE